MPRYSAAEKQFVLDNCHRLKDKEIARTLARLLNRRISVDTVRRIRRQFHIAKSSGNGVCRLLDRSPLFRRSTPLCVTGA